jgi:hypothetical protein
LAVAAVPMKQQFGWTQTEKGFVLSTFFVGYLSMDTVAPSRPTKRRKKKMKSADCSAFCVDQMAAATANRGTGERIGRSPRAKLPAVSRGTIAPLLRRSGNSGARRRQTPPLPDTRRRPSPRSA